MDAETFVQAYVNLGGVSCHVSLSLSPRWFSLHDLTFYEVLILLHCFSNKKVGVFNTTHNLNSNKANKKG